MSGAPTALIADDEPLLRQELAHMLAQAWPELQLVALARNGREAIEQFESLRPDICFLDIHMPGVTGMDAARHIGRRAHLVFVTAFGEYALQAFAHGVLDYLVKPVDAARLADTVGRLRERVSAAQPALNTEELLQQLALHLAPAGSAGPSQEKLRWIRASVGDRLCLIPVDDIDYLRADSKYTLVVWRDEKGKPGQALISTPLRELLVQLDTARFAQVHRSVVVNLAAISHVTRGANETADIHLKGHAERLPVSRSFLHLFKQM